MAHIKRVSVWVATIYLGVVLGMMSLERWIIYPAPAVGDGDWQPPGLVFEDAHFAAADGTQLHGWFLEHPNPRATVLFFHGNGEHVAYLANELEAVRRQLQVSVLAFDYRGYGKSQGQPYECGLLQDGEAAQQWLAGRTAQSPASIVLFGRSIGGAVAVHTAAKNGARGLVLDRTFDSLVNVASKHFPYLPVRWVLRNRFPAATWIQDYGGPLLQIHGEADEIIPFALGKQLFEAAPSTDKTFLTSPRLGHNDAWPRSFHHALKEFIDSLPP